MVPKSPGLIIAPYFLRYRIGNRLTSLRIVYTIKYKLRRAGYESDGKGSSILF
jgi:hypothetical protein